MRNWITNLPGFFDAATAQWPSGVPRDVSAPTANDGSPWILGVGGDLLAFMVAILDEKGIVANNVFDNATTNQVLTVLKQIIQEYPQFDEFIVNDKLALSGAFELPIEQDVVGLSLTEDDVALTNQDIQTNFKVITTDALVITGIQQPDTTTEDRLLILKRSGAFTMTLKHQDAGSVAANRMDLPGGNDVLVADGEFVALLYNPNLSRYEMLWRSQALVAGAASIGQTELKTAISTVSKTGTGNVILPGGEYGFYPQNRRSASAVDEIGIAKTTALGGFTTTIGILSGVGTMDFQQRHVTASPPYDLGNGHIPLFIFIEINAGAIVGVYVSVEPPWANNGPTDIKGQWVTVVEDVLDNIDPRKVAVMRPDDEGKLRRVIESVAVSNPEFIRRKRTLKRMRKQLTREYSMDKVLDGTITMDQFASQPVTERLVEMSLDFKNSDMVLIPQPFVESANTIIILDPTQTDRLLDMHDQDVDIVKLIREGYIKIGAEIPSAIAPPGVKVHSFSFKNT